MNCTIRVAKAKALISFAVTDLRLCFAYANCWFSHEAANLLCSMLTQAYDCSTLEKLFIKLTNGSHPADLVETCNFSNNQTR